MKEFDIHTAETAPNASQEALEQARQAFGMVPNLVGLLAESPAAVQAYTHVSGLLDESGFSPRELQVLLLAVSVENRCHYCVPAHSVAAEEAGLSREAIEAVRAGEPVDDPRLEALRSFAVRLVRERGFVDEAEVEALKEAGFEQAQVLEAVTAVALKTLSNYVNHLAETPLDPSLERWAWKPRDARKSA